MIPKGWQKVTVSNLCETVSVGIVVKPTQYYTTENTGIKAFRSANVHEGIVNDSHWIYITPKGHAANSKSRLRTGDVLIVRSGAPGTSCVVPEEYDNTNCIDIVFARPKINLILPEYLSLYTNSELGRKHVFQSQNGLAIQHFNVGQYKKMEILLPPLAEQRRISALIGTWGLAIEMTNKLIVAKKISLQYMVDTLIGKPSYPKEKVQAVTSELSCRNSEGKCQQVLSVTNQNGFVLPEDQFERRVASENISNYKMVKRGQYAFNPSRINVGSIARLDNWDEAVLSPMYIVFGLDAKKINSDFFLYWLSSYKAQERIKRSSQGSVRETVSYKDFGEIDIPLPTLELQQNIANVLNTVKREINLLHEENDLLRKQKRGLMRKLLTGQCEIKPGME